LRRIIVDASVLLAGLFKEGVVRDILLNFEDAEFLAPSYIREEVERHIQDVVSRTGKPEATVRAVLDDLFAAIDLVPPEAYSGSMEEARGLARSARAFGDEDYIALALALDAPVWTLDRDFRRTSAIKTLPTSEIEQAE